MNDEGIVGRSPLRLKNARGELIDCIHGARVVDVVGGNQRSVEGARPVGVKQLEGEVLAVRAPEENAVGPEVLRADIGA